MKDETTVPNLRFKEFNSAWKLRRMNDILLTLTSGVSVNSTDEPARDNSKGVLKTSCINNGLFNPLENKEILEKELVRIKDSIKGKTILVSRMNTPQLVGEHGYVPKDYPDLYVPDRLWVLEFKTGIHPKFVNFALSIPKYRFKVKSFASGTSGTMKNISQKEYISIKVLIPELEEQQKIATFLSSVDKKIELLQEKKDKLEEYKKGMMQKIFSQKIRFKDENEDNFEDWGVTSLRNLFEERKEYNENLELLSVTQDKGIIKRTEIDAKDNSNNNKSKYKVVKSNDIAYNSMRMWQGAFGVSKYSGIVSPAYTVIFLRKKDYSIIFFKYFFKTPALLHKFYTYSQGLTSDTWNLKYPLFSEIRVSIPNIKEQEKIASFLSALDKKIDLVDNQLIQTQQFKKALLQQMFV